MPSPSPLSDYIWPQVEELQAQLEQRAREEVDAAVQTLDTPPPTEATPPMVMPDVLEERAVVQHQTQ